MSFITVKINPMILEEERQFQIKQGGGLRFVLLVESEEDQDKGEGSDDEIEDYKSVVSVDSITENADFIRLE